MEWRSAFTFAIALMLIAAQPAAADTEAWFIGPSMVEPRYAHTATLLPSGEVLVAGGVGNGILSAAEVFRPWEGSKGRWTSVGPLSVPRWLHAATSLASGKVLVTGGRTVTSDPDQWDLSSTELYDPAGGTWSATGSMAFPRELHTATLLASGKVLVTGGLDVYWRQGLQLRRTHASAELYDPATGTWSATGSMAGPRSWHTATLLPSGKVLVAGGRLIIPSPRSLTDLATAELYDPVAGTWSPAGSMSVPRELHAAILLPSGKVLVTGGTDHNVGAHRTAEIYDPATNTWSLTADMADGRYQHTATLLPSGRVLVAGGWVPVDGGGSASSRAELYDPVSATWSSARDSLAGHTWHTATLLPPGPLSGMVLVAGRSASHSSELYREASGAPVASTTTLTSSANPAAYGAEVIFTATVAGSGGVPTGSVTFMDGATPLASRPLDATGRAVYATSSLRAGVHSITVGYGGDGGFLPSTSSALVQVVDALSPVTTASVSPAPNAAGWNATSVTVTLTATDDLSGVASTTATLDGAPVGTSITVTTEGVHDLIYHSTDVVGNGETSRMLSIRIDRTPPIVSYSGNAGSYSVDQTVDIRCTASDPLNANGTTGSGIESTTCQDVFGPAYAFTVGANTYSATAMDRAGNGGSGSAAFTVVVTVDGLNRLIDRFVTNAGVAKALHAQLASIASAPNANAASGKLAAFADLINAQIGKSLTSDQAAILLQLVKAL